MKPEGNHVSQAFNWRKQVMKFYKCHIRRFIRSVGKIEVNLISAIFVIMLDFILLSGTGWAATYTAATCSALDVASAISNASSGDTVIVPAGNCTWGESGTYLSVNKAIVLKGVGQGQTNITLSDTGGTYTNATIRISAAATVRGMTINGSNAESISAFSVFIVNGWRITDIDYNGGTSGVYFFYVGNVYGVIDNNDITGGAGTAELIFVRGPTNSWQTPHSIGGADNVFVEDNTFNGPGYVCDCNSNSRCVIRYNTITGTMKIDGHGKASNNPPRGVRHMVVYNNTWTNTSNYWTAIELRGGGGRVFNNVIESSSVIWVYLTDYAYTATWTNFSNTCRCPADYPVDDQIGVGRDPKLGASEPMYLWNNTKNGLPLSLSWKSTDSCQATCGVFSVSDVIVADRDYFISDTKPAAMDSYTPFPYPHPLTITPNPPSNIKIQ